MVSSASRMRSASTISCWRSADRAGQQLLNSLYLSIGTATLTVLVASAAAYPLSAHAHSRAQRFPLGVGAAAHAARGGHDRANFLAAKQLHGLNMPGMIVAMTILGMPFALLLLKNFFDTVPIELEEAAYVEGASVWQILRLVVVPLSRSGVAVVWVLHFHRRVECVPAAVHFRADRFGIPDVGRAVHGRSASTAASVSAFSRPIR